MGVAQSKSTQCVLETPKGSLAGIEYWGKTNKPVCRRFTKIPYAQPPVGELRWRRPQPLANDFSFSQTPGKPGNYTGFGPICPQPDSTSSDVQIENRNAAPEPEAVQKEDCLYLNIWAPAGEPPEGGWPVQFFIHGGWLQFGNASQTNTYDPFDLLLQSECPRIIVSATYRLNLFGFMACNALAELGEERVPGNYGFWDQRAALEWTAKNIKHFSGNAENITVGGLSAGGYSALFQLYYDTYLPASQRLIKRIFLNSNAVGVQPNAVTSAFNNAQFDELCSVLSISALANPAEKLQLLRGIHSTELVEANSKLKFHTFRASTDNGFIPDTFLKSIHDGSFTTKLAEHGVQVMLGEVKDENLLYKLMNPPSSSDELRLQLKNYYPAPVVEGLMKHYPLPGMSAPPADWADIYGKITADCQVHATVRGFAHSLLDPPKDGKALPLSSVHRYRIEWRAKSLDEWLLPEVGVCHAADMPIWWCSVFRTGCTEEDKEAVTEWLKPFEDFIAGKQIEWGTKNEREMRRFGADGKIGVVQDGYWEEKMQVWEVMRNPCL